MSEAQYLSMIDYRDRRTRVLLVIIAFIVFAAWAFGKMLESTMTR